jgi:Bcr/CflA subfamily drug resistance transporter
MNNLGKTTLSLSTPTNKLWIALIVTLILPISGLAIDIFVPSLPSITQYFGTSKALAQLSITLYMLGLGVMQLFSGMITDTFGRKKPCLIAMAIFIIATLLISCSQSIYQLLFLRLLQGLTVGVFIVPLRSIIPDLFSGKELYKMTTYTTIAWSIGPIIAPAIGGYLQHYFGWQASFYFLMSYSIIAFLLILFLIPETSVYRHPFQFCAILKRYRAILSHREFYSGFMINGALYSIVILFAAIAPFLIQRVLHYSAIEFGHMALLTGLAWFIGTVTNRFLLQVPSYIKIKTALWGMLITAVLALLFVAEIPLNIYTIMIPACILMIMGGIIFPNNWARGMELFPQSSGSANALFASFVFLIPSLVSALGTFLKSTSVIPLTITYIGLIIFCLVIYYSGLHLRKSARKLASELPQ